MRLLQLVLERLSRLVLTISKYSSGIVFDSKKLNMNFWIHMYNVARESDSI